MEHSFDDRMKRLHLFGQLVQVHWHLPLYEVVGVDDGVWLFSVMWEPAVESQIARLQIRRKTQFGQEAVSATDERALVDQRVCFRSKQRFRKSVTNGVLGE